MSLLHNTNIEDIVTNRITGNIARVGGRMNQLITYKKSKVTDINIIDGGYGIVSSKLNKKNILNYLNTTKRQIRQEISWLLHGNCELRDRKTIILDMHFAILDISLQNKFENLISSNVIEHSPNPIWFLLNFHFITNENGYQFHAIPNYRYTFDKFRQPTPVSHMIHDFETMTWFDDGSHNDEYTKSAIVKHGHQRKFHETYPVSYPYIHFHVFDENNTKELIEYMFEDVTVDCINTNKFGDNLVIFRNKLNSKFLERHSSLINQFKLFVEKKATSTNYSRK